MMESLLVVASMLFTALVFLAALARMEVLTEQLRAERLEKARLQAMLAERAA